MKNLVCVVIFWLSFASTSSLAQVEKYKFTIDLTKINDDRVTVELIPPKLTPKNNLYHLPKVVPGTYAIHNYGAYIRNFRALDKKGNNISVVQIDKNSWKIQDVGKVQKIMYEVDDTWDTPTVKEKIFEPSGTNFQQDSVFVLNTFGLFGYFQGLTSQQYEVKVYKPVSMFGASALTKSFSDNTTDVYQAFSYHELADAPMMYCQPDTTSIRVSNVQILVSVYSPQKKVTSQEVAKAITPILNAQNDYLGGTLPVEKYTFLFYLSDNESLTRFGALEHSFSSFYFLPESMPSFALLETIKDAAAHEFFHILTPLNIHSEKIGNFDYINPTMSKHLWLYEGLTEYATHHAQIKGGLIDENKFLKSMRQKIQAMRESFNDTLSFTEMSANVLETYKEQYLNVYQKGAIIGLCLDIILRDLSKGRYGTQELMRDLAKKYGRDQSFQDDSLFNEIAQITYPEIRTFFRDYVEGRKPLPLNEIFDRVGIQLHPVMIRKEISLIKSVFFMEATRRPTFILPDGIPIALTELGQKLGIQANDEMISINGQNVNTDNFPDVLRTFEQKTKPGDTVTMVVLRKQSNGTQKEITLSTKAFEEEVQYKNRWEFHYDNADKVRLRKAWLGLKN